jgi:hypothetical protein
MYIVVIDAASLQRAIVETEIERPTGGGVGGLIDGSSLAQEMICRRLIDGS